MFDVISLHLQYKDNVQFHSGTALHVCHYANTLLKLYMYATMHPYHSTFTMALYL